MKAVIIKDGKGPADNLFIGEAPIPHLASKHVLIKVKAFGLNRADIMQRLGSYPPPPGASDILGLEFSGIVDSIGDDVSTFQIGDEVMGLVGGGAYAEFVRCMECHLMHKPAHLSWTESASIPENYLTAFQSLVLLAELKHGEDVLIHAGASGVGIAATQIARFLQARTVTITTSSDEKIAALSTDKASGPTHAINYKSQAFPQEIKKIARSGGVDVLIDFIGADYWAKNLESLAVDGRMILVGMLSGMETGPFSMAPFLFKRLRVQGTTLRNRGIDYQAQLISRFFQEMLPYFSGGNGSGPLRPIIHKVIPWENIVMGHKEMESNANIGKIVAEIP